MEKNSYVSWVIIDFYFCLYYVLGFFSFSFFSNHAFLIFNISLTFYFSIFKTQSFSYKSHPIKTVFAILNKFKFLFTFEIEQLKYLKMLKT